MGVLDGAGTGDLMYTVHLMFPSQGENHEGRDVLCRGTDVTLSEGALRKGRGSGGERQGEGSGRQEALITCCHWHLLFAVETQTVKLRDISMLGGSRRENRRESFRGESSRGLGLRTEETGL